MKRQFLLAISFCLAFLTLPVMAGGNNGPSFGGTQFTDVDVSNRISNDVRANANAFAVSSSKSSSNSAALNLSTTDVRNSNGGNVLTVNEAPIPSSTKVTYDGNYTIKNTPNFALGNVYPTAPCMGSSNIGGSGPGFSIGVGTSWRDDECGIRETARSFRGMGLDTDALVVLCTSQYAAVAPSCLKVAPQPVQQ